MNSAGMNYMSVLSVKSATMNSILVNNVYMNSDTCELVGSITPPKFSKCQLACMKDKQSIATLFKDPT